ncbi:hypothetical protein I7I51_00482 [Histoplasma capsulatum]|uniref:TMEM205-like domain-containing protein n=1 Tax=Ajellomyces capsulatus TaxID=5037 RepID=A0A8A1MFM9_AJECA|nr:conserved hypothetical protein [Histoplasma mississippiense (nom. inval.)]EDN08824.1 conserved hypothetical protein [Histoplasma mississippiense (nom. inval.)]QSS63424.1 hypothetical protein I7I51_00482 [Histoplasma capsulatum]
MTMPTTSKPQGRLHSYGTLLGAQLYQTFVGGIIAYRTLPRPQFSTLQASMIPVYFTLQASLPVVVALTYPGERPFGGRGVSGLSGVLAEGNRTTALYPLLTMFLAGLTNRLVLGPMTAKIMRQRRHQETIDGKKCYDPAPHSKEMLRLNRTFAKVHGVCSLVSLLSISSAVYYGVVLANRLE